MGGTVKRQTLLRVTTNGEAMESYDRPRHERTWHTEEEPCKKKRHKRESLNIHIYI